MNDLLSELESMADLALQANAGDDHCYGRILGQQPNSHSTSFIHGTSTNTTTVPKTNRALTKKTYYLIKLDGPLSSPETVRVAGGLSTLPETFTGSSNLKDEEDDESSDLDDPAKTHQQTLFCRIDNITKDKILSWLPSQPHFRGLSNWRPTIIKDSAALKDLSATSAYPTLGMDTTLPQNRPNSTSTRGNQEVDLLDPLLRPSQNEYPTWYFFYGTLADPTVLRRLFNLPGEFPITYHPGKLKNIPGDGSVRLTTWGKGKYNALVDFTNDTHNNGHGRKKHNMVEVKGQAYLVLNREQEDALRYYETDEYEVVRCSFEMEMDGGVKVVRGLTFRFTGIVDEV